MNDCESQSGAGTIEVLVGKVSGASPTLRTSGHITRAAYPHSERACVLLQGTACTGLTSDGALQLRRIRPLCAELAHEQLNAESPWSRKPKDSDG